MKLHKSSDRPWSTIFSVIVYYEDLARSHNGTLDICHAITECMSEKACHEMKRNRCRKLSIGRQESHFQYRKIVSVNDTGEHFTLKDSANQHSEPVLKKLIIAMNHGKCDVQPLLWSNF